MPFRIGVQLGDVSAEGERLYGDGVKVAARIEAMAEPGGILISDLVLRQVRGKLDASFTDLGEKELKNIPDPVRVYGVKVGPEPATASSPGGSRATRALAIAGAVIALDAAGLAPPQNPPLPDKPSIVVLPFEGMSGDPEQEYFSDGLSEDLTTQLSLNPQLFVIARNSAFTYKGQAVNVEQVGRALGVRYVLEGSVRRSGDRVRVTAQLIGTTSGFHLWSRRYDQEMAEIFALQDEISERIFAAVGLQISDAELQRARRKPTEDLNAYDAFQRGFYHYSQFRREDMATAKRWFERAIELDPNHARAISQLGSIEAAGAAMGWQVEPGALDRALELADRAQAIEPSAHYVYLTRAGVHLNRREGAEAEAAARRVIEIIPGEGLAHVVLGVALLQQQRFVEALASFRTAVRVNPRASEVAPMRGGDRHRPAPPGAHPGGRRALGSGPCDEPGSRQLPDSVARALRVARSA